MQQLQEQQNSFKSQLAQIANPPLPLLFPSYSQPNLSPQPPSPQTPNLNPNHHTCKEIFHRSRTSYSNPDVTRGNDLGERPS